MNYQEELKALQKLCRDEIEENIRKSKIMQENDLRIANLEAALEEEQAKNAILVAEKDKLMDELEQERNTVIFLEATGEEDNVSSSEDEDNDDDEISDKERDYDEYRTPIYKNGRWYLSCGCNRNYASKAAAIVCHSGKVYKSRSSGPVPCDFSNSMDI